MVEGESGAVGGGSNPRYFLRRWDRTPHQTTPTPTTTATAPIQLHDRSPVMKLCGAKATLRPCNIQTIPVRTRTTPETILSIPAFCYQEGCGSVAAAQAGWELTKPNCGASGQSAWTSD